MFFFFSILNESIPKDEADQLLQDLLHEMSKFLLQVTRRARNPNLGVVTLCILYNCIAQFDHSHLDLLSLVT